MGVDREKKTYGRRMNPRKVSPSGSGRRYYSKIEAAAQEVAEREIDLLL